jgi:hypothetical protein
MSESIEQGIIEIVADIAGVELWRSRRDSKYPCVMKMFRTF